MIECAPDDVALTIRTLSSTVRKLEKVLLTLSRKEKPNAGQIRMVEKDLNSHRLMLALLQGEGQASDEELAALSQVIHRYVEKIEVILPKFAPGTSQHTLAVRRIAAYESVLKVSEKQ